MKEIRTVRVAILLPQVFDTSVNGLLRKGWTLMPGSPFCAPGENGISELVAFLEREVPDEGL